MSKKIIVGNWKMNPQTALEAETVFKAIKKELVTLRNITTVICPPYVYIPLLTKNVTSKIIVGAQDVFYEEKGSFTGFISSSMLKNMGATHAIIGHSERRAHGETDEVVNKKIHAAIKSGLTPILCIGEKERSHTGEYLAFIQGQLHAALEKVQKKHLKNFIIAYEPVWAIGSKDFAAITSRDLHEMILYIRKLLTDMFDKPAAAGVPILYGGSVNSENCREFIADGEADGLLVGRQSLDVKDFTQILRIANGTN